MTHAGVSLLLSQGLNLEACGGGTQPSEGTMTLAWDDSPELPQLRSKFKLVRVGRSEKIRTIVLSPQLVGVWTHYFRGRSCPHEEPTCPACDARNARRWYGYLACWNTATDTRFLLELTPQAAEILLDYQAKKKSLRGLEIFVRRTGDKPNSPCETIIPKEQQSHLALPGDFNVREALMIIWGLAAPDPADPNAAVATRVSAHWRKNGSNNGASSKESNGNSGPQQPGRSRGPDGLHEQTEEASHLSKSPAAESTID